ncbi:TRAP transporter large permease [Clostridium sp. AM58-1XD]|uniref:TRAP transporter large permease n=1 Tax=Clostridium sp. AM58-1XD TaxID=2292307 RepID=UPI000E520534|nr:TRAP transporter large permease [Clostridium sp. AM58-1XD]RGZ01216.1 TRAP transporter large permease [Clostridium sp. AM58-1XD]
MIALALFGSFFVLLLCNVPVAASMGLATVIGALAGGYSLTSVASLMYAAISKNVLLAIPYFILTGVLMEYAGISKRLIRLAEVCVGHIKGGLAYVVIIVACFFAAISGSGPATVAALGGILIPAMEKNGYDKNMSAALVAASGGIGVIIPPSIAFVIFAMYAELSVGKLFICGIVPGLFLGLMYAAAATWSIRKDENIVRSKKEGSRERWLAFKDALWGLLTPFIILGGIYTGIFTATEAAGVAVVYSLFVGVFIYREIKIKDLISIFIDSAKTSAVVMYILSTAGILSWLLTTSGVAKEMSVALMSLSSNKYIILLLFNILFIIAGCFVEANSAFCLFLPILLPIIDSIGYSRYAFAIFMVTSFAVGMVTPPVGANLYVACNIGRLSMGDICKKIVPFVVAGMIAVLVLTYIPAISLFLPDMIGMKQ